MTIERLRKAARFGIAYGANPELVRKEFGTIYGQGGKPDRLCSLVPGGDYASIEKRILAFMERGKKGCLKIYKS